MCNATFMHETCTCDLMNWKQSDHPMLWPPRIYGWIHRLNVLRRDSRHISAFSFPRIFEVSKKYLTNSYSWHMESFITSLAEALQIESIERFLDSNSPGLCQGNTMCWGKKFNLYPSVLSAAHCSTIGQYFLIYQVGHKLCKSYIFIRCLVPTQGRERKQSFSTRAALKISSFWLKCKEQNPANLVDRALLRLSALSTDGRRYDNSRRLDLFSLGNHLDPRQIRMYSQNYLF